MNTKYFYTLIFASVIVITSCSKKLDEVNPDTSVRFETITANDLPFIINGTYLALTNNNFTGTYYLHDLMSDDVETLSGSVYNDNVIPTTDNSAGLNFQYAYKAIANVNMVIRFGENNSDSAVRQSYAQGKFLRAFLYNRLVSHYGGVPIKLGTESASAKPIQNTAEQVYDFIVNDLKDAIVILPDFVAGSSLKPSKQAAQALLARVYLQSGKAPEAKIEAQNVINSTKFLLETNFAGVFSFTSSSKENIFRIGEAGTSANSGLGFVYNSNNLAGNIWVDSNLVNSYEAADQRRALYAYRLNTNLGLSVYYSTKFPAEQNHAYPVLRYSEMFLIIAEATARAGTIDVSKYNELRVKRGATTKLNTDFASPQAFIDEIENERRREFFGEAQRWQDMRRFDLAIPFLASKQRPAGFVLLPIPERERFLNPNMLQNLDYQ